jgi:hypothetical protein
MYVAEFINTKDPDSDYASSIELQNEHVNETKKSKAGNKFVSPVCGPGMNSSLTTYFVAGLWGSDGSADEDSGLSGCYALSTNK